MRLITGLLAAATLSASAAVIAQAAPAPGPAPAGAGAFVAGRPIGVEAAGAYTAMSGNVKAFGSLVNSESCSYDTTRGLIVAPSRGAEQNQIPNDAFVSLINHDGSIQTVKWIGASRAGLVLNQPFGSDIRNGKLYLADRDGGTADGAPSVSVIRMFDLATGAPAGQYVTPDSSGMNDIAVAADGTVYATLTGGGATPQRVYKITPAGVSSVLIEGDPLSQPNGVAFDNDGHLVVVNIGSDAVLTFDLQGKLLKTEHAAQSGSDGLVILKDGTKYVSSVRLGGVSRIRPGAAGELIATGIPSAASMCYDEGANQLVIPMNANNGLAFIKLN